MKLHCFTFNPFNLSFILIIIFLISCSHTSKNDVKKEKAMYYYQDSSGQYQVIKEVGELPKKKMVFVKNQLIPQGSDENQFIEKSLILSEKSNMKIKDESIPILRPQVSQFTVWLDGQKYLSQMKVNYELKQIEMVYRDLENKKFQKKSSPLPRGNGIYCFYSQLPECVKTTGFLDKAQKHHSGVMSFHIIWDTWPYAQEQIPQLGNNLVSPATFEYDGSTSNNGTKFALKFGNQNIFYQFNEENHLTKKLWIAQGITQQEDIISQNLEENSEKN